MTTATLTLRTGRTRGLLPSLRPFWTAWLAWRRRAADARALAAAGRLGPRLLADMGIETETARTVVGDWDDLRPNRWLVRPRV